MSTNSTTFQQGPHTSCKACGALLLQDAYGDKQCSACARYPDWPLRPPTLQDKTDSLRDLHVKTPTTKTPIPV